MERKEQDRVQAGVLAALRTLAGSRGSPSCRFLRMPLAWGPSCDTLIAWDPSRPARRWAPRAGEDGGAEPLPFGSPPPLERSQGGSRDAADRAHSQPSPLQTRLPASTPQPVAGPPSVPVVGTTRCTHAGPPRWTVTMLGLKPRPSVSMMGRRRKRHPCGLSGHSGTLAIAGSRGPGTAALVSGDCLEGWCLRSGLKGRCVTQGGTFR